MLRTILVVFQFIVSIALVVLVVLQPSKGEGLGSIGGGARMFFHKETGLEALLSKATTVVAVVFMLASVLLTVIR